MRKIKATRWLRIDVIDGRHSFGGTWMRFYNQSDWEQILSDYQRPPVWVMHMNIVIGRAF